MAFASAEFIALCQSQILLLTRALDANSTVVYLAEQANHAVGLSLVPLVAYPETANVWAGWTESLAMMAEQLPPEDTSLEDASSRESRPQSARGDADLPGLDRATARPPRSRWEEPVALPPGIDWTPPRPEPTTAPPPLVLPLVHEGVALGVMVSTRESSTWSRDDRQQAEQVANTLALAWVLDQRGQWLQQQLQQRHLTQANQSETFHDLLHQFRNPLTALQTFGRLLVKRIPADDPNQPIAEGIVRESRRLQDLAQTFDNAIAQGDEGLQTAPQVPSVGRLLLPGAELAESADRFPDANYPDLTPEAIGPLSGENLPQRESERLGRRLQVIPGQMVEVVSPLLQSTLAIAQERDLHVITDLPLNLPAVWMDEVALAEVLSNLLDNALKYAPAGALVWIRGGMVQQIDGHLFQGLGVGDTGTGIPLADQARIFERHFRGVQAMGNIPGTGLGLAIAQELIEAMGGHLELISPVPMDDWVTMAEGEVRSGPGTLFIVWLPTV